MDTRRYIAICAAFAAVVAIIPPALAQPAPQPSAPEVNVAAVPPATDDASALAEKLQNLIGDLISVPFQNNINFNVGPHAGTQDNLNIQLVIPIHLNDDWNLITRTILRYHGA